MQFQLKVIRAGVSPSSMRLEAASDLQAIRMAEQQGYTVLRVRARGVGALQNRASKFPLLFFCQELRVLLEAGLTLPESIETLSRKETQPEARATLDSLFASLREGRPLSDAMAEMPQHFPSLLVASVRACETTGNLAEGLMRFSRIYEGRNLHLSTASEWLLWSGRLVEHHGLLILLGVVAALAASIFALLQPAVRAGIGQMMTRLPQIGARFRMYHLSRLYRTLGMLLRSGMPVVSALGMVN